MNEPPGKIYEFDGFRLDAAKRLLLKEDNEAVALMPKAFDTLLYLIERRGKIVEKNELLAAIWADTIVEENNLTQNVSILRRVFGEKPGENRFIATVPGKGYKFVAAVRESAAADGGETAAPEFEPERTLPLENPPAVPPTEKGNRFLFFALIVFAALGVAALGFYLRSETEKNLADNAPIKSLAVLPFKSLVAENRNETLELGMADALIAKLSGGETFVVRPLSAVRRYNSPEQDSLTAGRELAAEAVLDGNVQMAGDRVRVTARLLRTADGRQLWAGQFDEQLKDIFNVQDSISERVVAALKIRLGRAEKKRPTENVEAYELYMKGRFHTLNLTRAETDKGIAYFEQAIEIDPNYALAYVGLAQAYLPMALTSGAPSWEALPKAKLAALRAIELDETLAEAYATLGLITFWYDWDWQAAEKQYRRAVELDPNSAEAHFGYAHLLSNVGRHEQALNEIKLSRELDPVALRTNALEGQILFFAGKSDAALDRLNKTIDLNPNFWLSHLFIASVYLEKGMYREAVTAFEKAGEITGNSQSKAYRAYALARWGKTAEARAELDELLKLSKTNYVPSYHFAVVYNGLGEGDKALDYLEKAFAEKNVLMVFLKVEPTWNNLRAEPRFIELMRRMNFE
jgi:DNA-binding winged helix-turn-helix (wHTH) protein/TolB-like protein/Tfp pilus assembly protein PilF